LRWRSAGEERTLRLISDFFRVVYLTSSFYLKRKSTLKSKSHGPQSADKNGKDRIGKARVLFDP
jgi:hypothetical protein